MIVTPRLKLYAILAGVLLMLGLIFGAYRRGRAIGEESTKIAQLDSLVKVSDAKIKAAATVASAAVTRADSAERIAAASVLASDRRRAMTATARAKVLVVGDTVDGAPLPDVANLIRLYDSLNKQDSFTISVQAIAIAQKDSAIAALNQVIAEQTAGIRTRDAEIGVLKGAKRPRFGFKTGVVVGVLATVGGVLVLHR